MSKHGLVVAVVAAVGLAGGGRSHGDDRLPAAGKYPEAPHSETVDDYHGTKVADRFRPLEDPDSPATRAWVEAENRETFGFSGVDPAPRGHQAPADRAVGFREVCAAVP